MPNDHTRFAPRQVCGVSVPPVLAKLYWLNEREEALIEHVASLLNPGCSGALVLAAVKARFAAVAEWATREQCAASVPQNLSDDAVLQALALAPLRYVRGAYRFETREFAAALRAISNSGGPPAASIHLH
jgi:hypothetical protein